MARRTHGFAALAGLLAALACSPAGSGDPSDRAAGAAPGQVAGAAAAERPAAPRPAPRTAWVIFGADTVVAEVARTDDERAQGLMYRQEVPDGTGMLFVFQDSQVRSFWMQNTYVPLDIAFLDASLTVVDIQQMEPLSTDFYTSKAPAMFALEVRQGWFAEMGIVVGARPEVVFAAR